MGNKKEWAEVTILGFAFVADQPSRLCLGCVDYRRGGHVEC